jgi:hypothetical protein
MKTDDLPRTESLALWLTTAVKGDDENGARLLPVMNYIAVKL